MAVNQDDFSVACVGLATLHVGKSERSELAPTVQSLKLLCDNLFVATSEVTESVCFDVDVDLVNSGPQESGRGIKVLGSIITANANWGHERLMTCCSLLPRQLGRVLARINDGMIAEPDICRQIAQTATLVGHDASRGWSADTGDTCRAYNLQAIARVLVGSNDEEISRLL